MSFVTSARGLAALAVLLAVVGGMLYLRFRGSGPQLRHLLLGQKRASPKSGAIICSVSALVIVLALLARVIAPVGALFPIIGALFPYAVAGLCIGALLVWRGRT